MNFLSQTTPKHASAKALHPAMFTSKYRGATGTPETSDSGWFQALTKLGGSQSSRGTTAAFQGMLMRSATIGDADEAVAPRCEFGPRYGIAPGSASSRRDTSDHKNF